jgi:hypothetical protein
MENPTDFDAMAFEIKMWREKFLLEHCYQHENPDKNQELRNIFYGISSKDMTYYGPTNIAVILQEEIA